MGSKQNWFLLHLLFWSNLLQHGVPKAGSYLFNEKFSYVDTGNGIWPCLRSIAVWHSCKKQRCSQHHKQSDWESVDGQMHSSLYSNGGDTRSSSILFVLFLELLSFFKLSSTIVVLVSWICRKVRGVKNTIFAFTLYFLLAKMKKGVTMSWNQMQVKDFVTES